MKRKWSKLFLVLSLGMLTCLLLAEPLPAQTRAAIPENVTAKKKLLILHSYYKGFEWTDLIDQGIGESMHPFNTDVSIYTEYMDLKRFPERPHIASLREVYRIKYSKVRFDAVLCTDDHAFQFLLDYRDELFPGVPVVFCGVNDFDFSMLKGHPGFTGKQERLNVQRTIEIALGINPDLKKMIIVADTTPTGVGTLKEVRNVAPGFANRVRFEIVDDIAMSDLLHQISRLSEKDAVLLLNFNRDKNGNNFQHSETIGLLQGVSKAPIYGMWDFFIGRGIVGGVITSGIEIGKVAGHQAIRILSGEKAENIPIETDFPQRIIFDDAVMKKFGITKDNLPAETTLINLPMTFYRVNKTLIWTLGGLLIFLSVTTLVLILNIAQRKRAQTALLKSITKEKFLQEEADLRLRQLIQADKLASLGEVVAGVAHEINNPNAFISYNIPLLKESWDFFRPAVKRQATADPQWRLKGMAAAELCSEMDDILDDIGTSSQRISQVVSDLKDFARMDDQDAGREVQINDVVKKALNIVGPQIRKSFVEYTVHLAPELPPVLGHFTKLEQVVANLVVNASQAVPAGKRSLLTIHTEHIKHRECVAIHVQDTGSGIAPHIGDKVFEPFFTTRAGQGGTGLGLSVSRRLVEEHRGAIVYVSRPGSGTRFSVLLPVGSEGSIRIRPALLWIGANDPATQSLSAAVQNWRNTFSVITADNEREAWTAVHDHCEIKWVVVNLETVGGAGPAILAKITERAPLVMRAFYGEIPREAADGEALSVQWTDAWLRPPSDAVPGDEMLTVEKIHEDIDRGRRTDRLEVAATHPASA